MAHNDEKDLRFISTEEVISSAMMALGQTDDAYRNIFREWVYLAQRAIGLSSVINIKETLPDETPIVDFAIEKPCDLLAPIDMLIIDEKGVCVAPDYVWNFIDRDRHCSNTQQSHRISVSENQNQFLLSSNATGFTKAILKYYAMMLDDDGLPLIPEYNQRAIMSYIEFMYTKRERRRKRNEIPLSEVDWMYNNWVTLKMDAVGYKNMPSTLKMEEIVRKWVTLLPNTRTLNKNRKAIASITGILRI